MEMYGKQIFLEYKVTNSWWALRDQIMHFKSSIDDVLWQPNSFFYLIFQFQGEDVREFLNSIWRTELEGARMGVGFLKGTGDLELIADPAHLMAG